RRGRRGGPRPAGHRAVHLPPAAHRRGVNARPDRRGRATRWLSKARRASLRLAVKTYEVVTRHRIAGMAGEASFFTLLALPPLLFGLVGTIGYLARTIGEGTVLAVRTTLEDSAATVL